MLHSISFEIIISICLYKISFIKTTYANIKIVILSNEKFYYWYKYFYSIVQLEYYVMLLFSLLNTNYFINDGEEVEQVCTNQECKACLYTVNFVTSHQVK